MKPRNVLYFSSAIIFSILASYLCLPFSLTGNKPNIFLATFGFWLEILVAIFFLISAISNRLIEHVTLLGVLTFSTVILARKNETITNLYVSIGTNNYIQVINLTEFMLLFLLLYSAFKTIKT